MTYPHGYEWLATVGTLPLMVQAALPLVGTLETPGAGNTSRIMRWADETGVKGYSADSVPWCGLFMAVVAQRAHKTPPANPLWALNWSKFGEDAGQPMLGDVLTFVRDGGGHVALYIGEDQAAYHVLGGNQSDSVSVTRILKKRLYRARSPFYDIAQPASVKPYVLTGGGALSTNEA